MEEPTTPGRRNRRRILAAISLAGIGGFVLNAQNQQPPEPGIPAMEPAMISPNGYLPAGMDMDGYQPDAPVEVGQQPASPDMPATALP